MDLENSSPIKPQNNDSDDEAQNFREEINFSFKPERNTTLSLLSISGIKSETMFIATAGHASAYLLAKNSEKSILLGYIYNETVKIADIYNNEDTKSLFVIFELSLPLNVYFDFSVFFFEKFSAPKIVILDSCHPNALPLFPKASVELPVLRSIVTTKGKGSKPVSKPLESACPIRGIAGDILCYCEVNNIFAELYLLVPSDYDIIVDDILLFDALAEKYTEVSKKIERKQLGTIVTKVSAKNASKNLYL